MGPADAHRPVRGARDRRRRQRPRRPDRARSGVRDRPQLRPLIEGADALANERLWDRMYRSQVHGRKGVAMMAISAVDCAMWDLKGRMLDLPVYRLLGGPTRERIPAYASALGYSLEPERAAEEAARPGGRGLRRHEVVLPPRADRRPRGHGRERAPRRGAARRGRSRRRHHDRRLDELGRAVHARDGTPLEPYRPRWIEEPVLPDKIDSYAEIRRQSPVPISGGEHEYTRWGVHQLLARRRGRRPAGRHRTGPAASPRCSRSVARLGLRHAGHPARPLDARKHAT